jgi:hypothetical protein
LEFLASIGRAGTTGARPWVDPMMISRKKAVITTSVTKQASNE